MIKVYEVQSSYPSHPRDTFLNLSLAQIWGAELASGRGTLPFPSFPPSTPAFLVPSHPPSLPRCCWLQKEIHTYTLFKNAFLKATFRTDNR